MAYGVYNYKEIEGAPEYLKELKIRAVFSPRQDGSLEHYAFLNEGGFEVYSCGDLEQLVKEAEKRKKELGLFTPKF